MRNLLTREQFKEEVFKRDAGRCVVCGDPAVDAHHILERKLWEDGGYYLDNGVSVCSDCHVLCEKTLISTDELRQMARIENILLPEGFENEFSYDKWGNYQVDKNTWRKGPLFDDDGCQKMLKSSGLYYGRIYT